ncbi:MAG: DUF2306 domain-containing protein [Caulobacteraceae bacterium]
MSVSRGAGDARGAPLRGRLAPAFLILLGVAALFIGLNTTLVSFRDQAASVAAFSGKVYADVQLGAFARNPVLIRAHAAMGSAFVVIAAFQYWRKFRTRYLLVHRIMGYVGLTLLLLLPITGVAASIVYPFSGVAGVIPNVVWGIAILFCVARAWTAIRRRDVIEHEAWVVRATAMTVGISLSRLYEPILVQIFHMEPHMAVAAVFWLGQGEGLLVAESWLRRPGGPLKRKAARRAAMP